MSTRFAEAIRHHRVVEFSYKGRTRSVEPHAVGYDGSGALVLHGWDLSSRSQGFRGFDLREIRALTVTRRSFDGARPEHASQPLMLHRVVCAL